MEIRPDSPSDPQRHVTWAANRKVRAATSTLDTLRQAWLTHCQSGHITLEESRHRVDHTISYIVRVTDTTSVEHMEGLLRSCVSDARSALSNLVHDLAKNNGASIADLKASDFPIASTDAAWTRSRGKLKGLPADTVERIHQVQPLSQPMPPNQRHPLELLRDLNNEDKHRQGLWIAPILGPEGVHKLAEIRWETTPERMAAMQAKPPAPDEVIDYYPHPLTDGSTVLRIHLPNWLDVETDVTVQELSVPLTLSLVAPGGSGEYPLLAELKNALTFTRSTNWWVAGLEPCAPEPFRLQLIHP